MEHSTLFKLNSQSLVYWLDVKWKFCIEKSIQFDQYTCSRKLSRAFSATATVVVVIAVVAAAAAAATSNNRKKIHLNSYFAILIGAHTHYGRCKQTTNDLTIY